MPSFLSEIKEEKTVGGINFLQPNLQTQEITKAATSGSKVVDLAFKHINKIANNLDNLERKNELLDIDRISKQNVNEYEISWGDKDKYSSENYGVYKKGLSDIYKANKALINDTKFTKADDVNVWNSQIDIGLNNKTFVEDGKRNQYRTRSLTDHTLLNVQSLNVDYKNVAPDDNEGKLKIKKQALDMYNNLSTVGVPKYKIEQLKMQTLIDFDDSYMTKELDDIVNNPDMTYKDKVNQLNSAIEAISSPEAVDVDIKQMILDKVIPNNPESIQMYKNLLTDNLETKYGGDNGLIKKSIFKLANNRNTNIEKATKEVQGIFNNIKSGNTLKAIATIEGIPISSRDLVSEENGLSKKYYGMSVQEIQASKEYIPAYTLTEINALRSQNRVDLLNGVPRNETIKGITQNINRDTVEGEMQLRQLYKSGVINQFEYSMIDKDDEDTIDFVDGGSIGRANKTSNKLNNFVWISTSNVDTDLRNKIDSLSFEKRQIFSEIITGMALKNGGYGALDVNGDITPVGFNNAYRYNEEFKSKVDSLTNNILDYSPKKYKEAKFKFTDDNIEDSIVKKYGL